MDQCRMPSRMLAAAELLRRGPAGRSADRARARGRCKTATGLASIPPFRGLDRLFNAAERLSSVTKTTLNKRAISLDQLEVPDAVARLERDRQHLSGRLSSATSRYRRASGDEPSTSSRARSRPRRARRQGLAWHCPRPPRSSEEITVPRTVGQIRPVGIADLMVVRQELLGYELGEIAHVESVLQGEVKERTHRRLFEQEESVTEFTQTFEESERDLQTSERFELQRETEWVVQLDAALDAGVTVTSRYGPFTDVAASVSAGVSRSQADASRLASSYARDVTERAVNRLQQLTSLERVRIDASTVEETNVHGIDNAGGSDHVNGIYRFIDKVFEAQIVNYGKRLLFDLVIPEPAAFARDALAGAPRLPTPIERPDPPGYCRSNRFVPLSPKDLSESNYIYWVGRSARSRGSNRPPPLYRTIATAFDQSVQRTEDVPASISKSTLELQVPAGYQARRAFVTGTVAKREREEDPPWFEVVVGRRRASASATVWLDGEDDKVPLAFVGARVAVFIITVEVVCERSREAFETWQMETFAAIMLRYRELESGYQEQVAAAELRSSGFGRNPDRNREISAEELKKLSISLITGQHSTISTPCVAALHPSGILNSTSGRRTRRAGISSSSSKPSSGSRWPTFSTRTSGVPRTSGRNAWQPTMTTRSSRGSSELERHAFSFLCDQALRTMSCTTWSSVRSGKAGTRHRSRTTGSFPSLLRSALSREKAASQGRDV